MGQADIERLITGRDLESVTGAEANGAPLLEKAHRTIATATGIGAADPYSSYERSEPSAAAATNWSTRTCRKTLPASMRPPRR